MTPQTYTLRYPFVEGPHFIDKGYGLLRDALDWLADTGRKGHLVDAHVNTTTESNPFANGGAGCDLLTGVEAVIVLSDPDTAMLLKLSLISAA